MFTDWTVVSRDYKQNWSIVLNPDINRNRPTYFKLYNHVVYQKATQFVRISFLEPKYIVHRREKGSWRLYSNKEKKRLIDFLLSHRRRNNGREEEPSNWQYAIVLRNVDMGLIDSPEDALSLTLDNCSLYDTKSPLPMELPMPDYLLLK